MCRECQRTNYSSVDMSNNKNLTVSKSRRTRHYEPYIYDISKEKGGKVEQIKKFFLRSDTQRVAAGLDIPIINIFEMLQNSAFVEVEDEKDVDY